MSTGDWWEKRACAGANPDWFTSDDKAEIRAAKSFCAECPVAVECLAFADKCEPNQQAKVGGVFGGLDGPERIARRKRLRAEKKATERAREQAGVGS